MYSHIGQFSLINVYTSSWLIYRNGRDIPFAVIIKWPFPGVAKKMPIGVQDGMVRGYERMAEYKNATAVQWSVMWYSETSAGCKMAVMVGGASCWAENRSQDLADLRSRTSREQLVGERGRCGEQKERGSARECAGWKGKRSRRTRRKEEGRQEGETKWGIPDLPPRV